MLKGKLLVFEGPDACGKTSAIRRMIKEEFPNAFSTREPGGTEFAEKIRALLLSAEASEASAKALLISFFASRADHFDRLIWTNTQYLCRHVFSDRLDASTFAFQVYGAENYHLEDLFWYLRKEVLTVQPHYFYFRIASAKTSETRISGRKQAERTWFDKQPYGYHERVIRGYEIFFKDISSEGVTIIDAEQDEQTVYQEVLAGVRKVMG